MLCPDIVVAFKKDGLVRVLMMTSLQFVGQFKLIGSNLEDFSETQCDAQMDNAGLMPDCDAANDLVPGVERRTSRQRRLPTRYDDFYVNDDLSVTEECDR